MQDLFSEQVLGFELT